MNTRYYTVLAVHYPKCSLFCQHVQSVTLPERRSLRRLSCSPQVKPQSLKVLSQRYQHSALHIKTTLRTSEAIYGFVTFPLRSLRDQTTGVPCGWSLCACACCSGLAARGRREALYYAGGVVGSGRFEICFERTHCSGMVAAGILGICRLRRRVAPALAPLEMTTGGEHRGKGEAEHAPSPQQPEHVNVTNWINLKVVWSAATKLYGRR